MKSSFIILSLALNFLASKAFSQIVSKDLSVPNFFSKVSCENNHQKILNAYDKLLASEISRLADGYHIEQTRGANQTQLKNYKSLLSAIVIKKTLVDEMKKQLSNKHLEAYFSKSNKRENIFNLNTMKVDLDKSFNKAIEEASLVSQKENSFTHYATHKFAHELVLKTGEHLVVAGYKSFATGVGVNIVSGVALRSALIATGFDILKGAGFAAALFILTKPLMGGRLPPETIWLNILEEQPGLVINPEWMTDAGSPDDPWSTHCLTMQRETKRINGYIKEFLDAEEKIFIDSIVNISKGAIVKKPKAITNNYGYYIAPSDNTSVKVVVPVAEFIPNWALPY